MRTGTIRSSLLVALTLALSIGTVVLARGASGKTFDFSTKSKEAKKYAAEAVRAIESFQPQRLRELAEKAVEADPEFAFAQYLLGTALMPAPEGGRHIEMSVELARKASEAERLYIESVLNVRARKLDEGLAGLNKLAEKYPGERMVHMMIGQTYMITGKPEDALRAFETAARLDSSTPRVHGFIGNLRLLDGDYDRARESFRQALSRAPGDAVPSVVHYGIAYSHLYQGDADGAVAALNSFLQHYERVGAAQNFPPIFIWNSLGRVLLEAGKADESLRAYERGYETLKGATLPDDQNALWLGRLLHGRARALSRMGRHEEAWKEAEKMKKMIDDAGSEGEQFMTAYHYLAGYLNLERREYAKAVEHLKQGDLQDPFQMLLLARAYDRLGRSVEAQKLYGAIVENRQSTLERALSYTEARKKLKV